MDEWEKLKIKLDSAYDTLGLDTLKKFEDDRKLLVNTSISEFQTEAIQSKLTEIQDLVSSSSMQNLFDSKSDYLKYSESIMDTIENKHFKDLQEELSSTYESYLKTNISPAMDALKYVDNSIKELQKNDSYLDMNKYASSIASSLTFNTDVKDDLLQSAKELTSSSKKIETDMFVDKMNMLDTQRLAIPNIKIPKNPMIGQNEKIIALLNTQSEALVSIGKYISSQNEKLDSQNEIIKEEIKDNKSSAKQAFRTAIWSIGIAILATLLGSWITYDVYKKTDKSDNENQKILLEHIDKANVVESNRKQVEALTNILKAIQKNDISSSERNKNDEKQIKVLNEILKSIKD